MSHRASSSRYNTVARRKLNTEGLAIFEEYSEDEPMTATLADSQEALGANCYRKQPTTQDFEDE